MEFTVSVSAQRGDEWSWWALWAPAIDGQRCRLYRGRDDPVALLGTNSCNHAAWPSVKWGAGQERALDDKMSFGGKSESKLLPLRFNTAKCCPLFFLTLVPAFTFFLFVHLSAQKCNE